MSGDNAANTAKVQGYALCLPTKRMGLPRTFPIMLLLCHEIAEARRLPPPHIYPYLCSPPLPLLHTQAHEKAAMRTAREPMRTAAERKDCPKGRAWENGYYFLYDCSNSGKIIFGSFLNSFNEISSFSIFFMTSGKSFKANFSSFFIATRIPLTSSQYAFA